MVSDSNSFKVKERRFLHSDVPFFVVVDAQDGVVCDPNWYFKAVQS